MQTSASEISDQPNEIESQQDIESSTMNLHSARNGIQFVQKGLFYLKQYFIICLDEQHYFSLADTPKRA